MYSTETTKIKAKSKLILWCFVIICLALIGGAWEYLHWTQPLDEAVLIYKPLGNENSLIVIENAASASSGIENIVADKNNGENPEEKANEEENNDQQQAVNEQIEEPEPEFDALQEFLAYMLEAQQEMEQDVAHVSVLDRITQKEVVPAETKKAEQGVVFEENKIEVYDSEEGVVGVIDVTTQKEEKIVPAPVSETAEKENAPTENNVVVSGGAEMIENAEQDFMDLAEKAQVVAAEAENIMRENVQAEINRAEETGDEAPIVLIPGLQNM